MNKYIDKFVLLPIKQVALVALGVGVFYFFFYFDRGEIIDAETAGIKLSIETELQKKKDTEQLILEEETITKKNALLSEEIKEFNKQIVPELRHSELITYITSLCKDLGCTIPKIPERRVDADDRLPYFEKVKLDIRVEGRFPVLMRFMYTLVKSEKLYLINNLKLSRLDSTKSDSKVALEGLLVAFKQVSKEETK